MTHKDKIDKFGAVLLGVVGFCLFGLIGCVTTFLVLLMNANMSMSTLLIAALIGGGAIGLAFALTRIGRRVTAGVLDILSAFGG